MKIKRFKNFSPNNISIRSKPPVQVEEKWFNLVYLVQLLLAIH